MIKSAGYSCPILMKLEFYPQIFEKNNVISNFIKFRPARAEFFHGDRQMDNGQKNDEANSGFSQIFRKRLKIHAHTTPAGK